MFQLELPTNELITFKNRSVCLIFGGFIISVFSCLITGAIGKFVDAASFPAAIFAALIGLQILIILSQMVKYYHYKQSIDNASMTYTDYRLFRYRLLIKTAIACLIAAFIYDGMMFGIFINITIVNVMNLIEVSLMLIFGFIFGCVPCIFTPNLYTASNDKFICNDGKWFKRNGDD